jgi:leucyl-tRNA synthetase
LAAIKSWVNVKCPKCKGPAKRETDTMPNWAGSSWYFIRYIDPKNNKAIADQKKLKYWMPVDWYNGGMEHVTLHLLYSRFWHKFLYDIGAVPQPEPYQKRTSHGMVLAEDNRKMSKSWGNVINPDDIVKAYGADTLRIYEMFMSPFDQTIAWDTHGIVGVRRFLERLWNLTLSCSDNKKTSKDVEAALHRLIKKVSEDLDNAKFNTAVAAFMEFLNLIGSNQEKCGKETIKKLLILFAPFAPFITEELWQKIGKKQSIHLQKWLKHDSKFIKEEKIKLVIQINGKVRNIIEVDADISEKEAKEIALAQGKIKKWMAGKEIKKIIFVKGRLINIVV